MSEGFTEKVQSCSVSALDKSTSVLHNSSVSDVPQPSHIQYQGGGENNWNLDTETIEDKNPFSGFSEEHLNKLDEVLSSAEVRQILQQSVTDFGINMDLNNSIPSTSHDDDVSQESSDGDAKPMDQATVTSTFIDHAYCMPADRMPKIKTNVSPVLSITKMPTVETCSSPVVAAVLSPVVALKPLIPSVLPKALEKSGKSSDEEMEGAAETSTTSPRKSSRKRENKKYSEEEWETSPSPRGRGRGRGRGKSVFDDSAGNKRQSTRISDMRQREMAEKILKENRQALEAEKAQLAQEDTKTDLPRGRPRKTVKDGEVEKDQFVQEEGTTESPRGRTRQAAKDEEVEKEELAQTKEEAAYPQECTKQISKEGEIEKEQCSQEETKAESPRGRTRKAAKDNEVDKDDEKEEKETMENDEEEKETPKKPTETGIVGKKVTGKNAVGKKEKAKKEDAMDENEDKDGEADENIDVGNDKEEIKDDKVKKKVKKKVGKKGAVTRENNEKKENANEVGNKMKGKGKKGKLKLQGQKKVKRVGKFKKVEGEQDKESEEEEKESVSKKKVTKKLLKKKVIVKVNKLLKKKTIVKIKKCRLKKKAEEKKNENEEESRADESTPKKKKMKKGTTGDGSKNEGKSPGKKKKGKVDSDESSNKMGDEEEEGGKMKVKRKRVVNAEVDEQCDEKGEKKRIKKDLSKKNGQTDMGMKTDEEDEIPLKKLKKNADQAKLKEEIKKKKKREQTEKNDDVPLKKLKSDIQEKESSKEGLDNSTTKTDSEQESVNMKKDRSKDIDSRRKSVIDKDSVEKGGSKVEKRRDSKDSKSSYDSKDGKHHHHHHHAHGHSFSIERRDSKDPAKHHKDEKHGYRHESIESRDSSTSGDKKGESKEKVTPIKSIDYKDFVKSLKAEKKKRKSEEIIFDPTVTDLFKPDVIKTKEEPVKETDKSLDKNKKDLLDSKEVNKDCIGSVTEQTVKVELSESSSHKSNSDLTKELDFQEFIKREDSDVNKDETASVEVKADNVSDSNTITVANIYVEDNKDNSVFTDSVKNKENIKEELEETKLVPKVIEVAVPKRLEKSGKEKDDSNEQEVKRFMVVSVSTEEEHDISQCKGQSEQASNDTEKEKHGEDVEKRRISKDLEGNKEEENSSKLLLKKEVDMPTNKELQRKDSGRALRESSRKSLALIESLKEKPGKELEEEEIDDVTFEDDQNDETWEDPSKLYCICRQPHNKRFMICCDKCEEWYHGKCVGISATTGKEMELNNEEYICLKCSGKEELNKKSLQTGNQRTDSRDSNKGKSEPTPLLERLQAEEAFKIESKKVDESKKSSSQESAKCNMSKKSRDSLGSIQKHSPEKSDDKKKRFKHFRVSSEKAIKEKSSSYQQCMGEDCQNEARKDSIYCSNECIVKHAQNALKVLQKSQETGSAKIPIKDAGGSERVAVVDRKTGQVLSGSKAPSKAELEKWLENHPTYEVFAPSSKVTPSKKTEDKGSSQKEKEKKEKEKDKHSIEKVKDRPKDSRNSTDSKPPVKTPEGPDPVRLNVRKSLRDALAGRSEGADDVMLSSSEIKGIALAIEEELFKYFRDTGHKYKAKYRSLIFNIKDPKNCGLFRKILSRRLKPYKLVRMSPEELASQELAKWRAQEAKHTLQMIEKTETEHSKESTHVVKKTHKGEVEVEEEQDLSSLVEAKKEPLKIDPKADLLSELIPDTTDQHRQHLFDLNCKICTGKMANPDESAQSKIVQKTEVAIKSPEMEKKEKEEAKEKPIPPEEVVREVMKAIQRAKREADSSTARQVTVRSPDSALQSGLEKKATFTPSGPMLWKGFIFMQEVSKFVTTAYRITGPTDHMELPDTIHVCGRINPEQVWDYLSKIKQTGSKDICAIRFIPGSQEEKTAYIHLYSYLNSRSRCGVVGNASKLIKDFYIVPLASHSKIPSVLKPFDGPGFEENRPHMLIGVIVRQKPKQPGAVSKEPVEVKHQHQAPQDPRKQKVAEKVVKKAPASYTPTSTTQPLKVRGPGTPTSGKRSASSTPQTSSSTPASTPKSVSSSSEKGAKPSKSIIQDRIIKEYSNVEEAEEDSPYEPPDSGPNEDDEAYDPEREDEKNKPKSTTSVPKSKQGTGVIGGETMSKIIQKIAMSKNPAEATAAMVAALASTKGLGNQRRLLMELTQNIDQQKKLLEAKRREVQGGDLAGVGATTGMEALVVSTDSSQSMTAGSSVVSTAVESIAVSSVVTTSAAVGRALASTIVSMPDVSMPDVSNPGVSMPGHSATTSNVDVKISAPTAVSDSNFTSSLSSVGLNSVQDQPGTRDIKPKFESSTIAGSVVSFGMQNEVTNASSVGLTVNEKDQEKQSNSRKQVESSFKVPETGDNAVSSSVSVKDEASKIKDEEEPESETPAELPTALQSLFSFIPSGSVSGLKIIKTKIPVTYSSGPKKSEKDASIISQTTTSVSVVCSETSVKSNDQDQTSVVSIEKSDVSATGSTEKVVQDQKVTGTTKAESTGPEKKSKTKTFLGFEYDSDSSEGSFEGFDVDDVRKESPRKKSSRVSSKQIDTVAIPGLGSLDQLMEDNPSEQKEPDSTDPNAVTDFGDTDIRIGQQPWRQPLGNIEPDLDLPDEDQDLRQGFGQDMRFDQDMRHSLVDVDERIQGPLYLQPLPPGVHSGHPGGLLIRPPIPGEPQDIDQRIAPFPFPGPPGIRPRLPFMALNQPPPPGEDWQPGQPAPPPLPPRPLIRPPPPPLPPHPPEPIEKKQPSEMAEDSDMRSISASEKSGDPEKEEKEKQKGKAKIKDKNKRKDSSELTSDERLKQIVLQIASQPQPAPMKPPPVPPVAMGPVGSLSSQGIMSPHQGPVLSEGMMPLHSSLQPISQGIPGVNLGPGPMQPGHDHHWQCTYTEANMPPMSEIHSSGMPPMSRESYQPSSSGINSTAVMQHQPSIPSLLDLPSQSVGSTQLPSRPHIERDRFRHRSRSPHVSQEDIDYSENYNKPRDGYPRSSMSRLERGNRSDFRGRSRGRARGHNRDWHGESGGRDRGQRHGGHRSEGRSRHSSMDYSEY